MTAALRPYRHLLWLAPAVLYLLVFSIYPLIYSLDVAFTTTTAGRGHFTLANFTRLTHDRLFFVSLGQTAVYLFSALVVELLLGLALALLVDWGLRASIPLVKPARSLLLIPMLLPPVVVAVIWRLIYNPDFGVLNGSLRSLGLDTKSLSWIDGENTAMLS